MARKKRRGDGAGGGIEARLGYRFKDPGLLERALTHRSFAHERAGVGARHYARLEFLGDALLGFVVSDWFWRADPEAPEGVLTRRKQEIVRAETLAQVARSLGIGDALRLGRGEQATGGRNKASLLADVFESILGAIYADGGLRSARAFVNRHLGAMLESAGRAEMLAGDHKTRLQEEVQGALRVTPRYRITGIGGVPHAREFEVEVVVGKEVWGTGRGTSRKQAEQEAAREALRRVLHEGG
jgi:ribonuclease-3